MSDHEIPNCDVHMSNLPKMEPEKKSSHSEIEKRRRDKMNQYINDLSIMIPIPPSVSKKPDKLTVLRYAVQHMKALKGSGEPSKETNHKPSFMSDDDLRNLITEAAGGFLIVVECDRGQILYVTNTVEEILFISQDDLVGFDFLELIHSKDIALVKAQLSTTVSENEEKKNISQKSPLLRGDIEKCGSLCPGAKRNFLCRMKKRARAEDVPNLGSKSTIRKTKANVFVDERDPVLVSYEGYLKSWPPKKDVKSSDPNSRSCLVAVGRVLHIDTEDTDYSQLDEISEFETRQKADATFIRVDKSFTKIFGYYPDEMIGASAYNFFHKDDLRVVAQAHHKALRKKCGSQPEVIYRFRAKAGHYIPLKTTSVVFRNPWSKEVDYIVTRSVVISSIPPDIPFSAIQNSYANLNSSENNVDGNDEVMSENLCNLLQKLTDFDSNDVKSQRKRGLNNGSKMMDESSRLNSVGDIGVALAEEARRIGQQLKVNSQSAKYSNLDRPKSVPRTSNFTENSPRETGSSVRGAAQENQRENADISQEDDFGQEHNSLTDGILMEQLAGIQGAIEAMENPGLNDDEEDSLSLLMNVMESGDLGSLSDMPWNLV